ncbi:MAG: transposase [Kiritimatiellia bacterium]
MARKNRVSVPDGIYHITSRIVNRELWFRNPGLKDEIVSWIHGIAAFSGVELLSWAVLDNHFHLVVHVPPIPERYRDNPAVAPESHAFGMRPPECRSQIWSLDPEEDRVRAARPPTGFTLSDEEMLERLQGLYGDAQRVEAIGKSWRTLRENGSGSAVDTAKERYCRRMYNLSQFVKTLKERIAQAVNRRTGHVGHVFEGRFYSGLVENTGEALRLVSLYVDYNPYRARLAREGEPYAWSSFGQACGDGPYASSCRAAYERIHGCPWGEARKRIEIAFRDRPKEDERVLLRQLDEGTAAIRVSQLVHLHVTAIGHGAFIGRGIHFGRKVESSLAKGFPCPSFKSLRWLERAVLWPEDHAAA